MSYEKLNKQLIELVGGKDNIKAVAHCVTRLRLTLKDRSLGCLSNYRRNTCYGCVQ